MVKENNKPGVISSLSKHSNLGDRKQGLLGNNTHIGEVGRSDGRSLFHISSSSVAHTISLNICQTAAGPWLTRGGFSPCGCRMIPKERC